MAEIDVLKAQIVRQDLSTPWGFVLQGGVDQGSPLKIQSLLPGSPAARIGLKTGDEVTEVGDIQTEGLTYQQVQDLIEKHGDTLILTVERRARGSVPINPVINATETEPLKEYQPYDMTGAQQHPAPVSVSQSSPKAKDSDTKQAVNPEDAPKAAAGSTSTAGSASTVETAPTTKTAPVEQSALEGKSPPAGDDVSVTETKSAVEPVSAIESSPAVELAQEVAEAGIKESVPHVTELAPLPKPLTIATTITEQARNLHYEQPVNVQPQQSTTKQRRRVRTRPTEATNIQPPSGPISQIVQGAYTSPFVPSKFKPEVQTEVYYPGTEPKPEPIRSYQPYDMSGSRSYQPADTQSQIYQFETVRARPFEDKPRPYYRPQAQSPPPPLVSPPQPVPPQQPQYMTYNDDDDYRYMPPTQPQQYSPRSYDYQDHQRPVRSEDQQLTQSRTFKVLESLMSSEEPAAGVPGLPPQRTLSQERWKAEQDAKRSSPRVKVFMPQQYNSPLGIYSAKNVVETFQAQAETVMDAMERNSTEGYPMSEVQKAVMDN